MSLLPTLVDNPSYKLLAFLVALVAWMYVQSQQVVDGRVRVSLLWRLPPGLTSVEPLPSTVMASVAGSRTALRRATEADLRMAVDVSDAEIGPIELELSPLGVEGLPAGLTVQSLSPGSLEVLLDEVTTRKLKVNPVLVGDPAPGYEINGVRIEPSVVEVSGPRMVIGDQVEISTKPIDISDIAGPAERSAELDLSWGVTYAGEAPVAKLRVESRDDLLTLVHTPISVLDSTSSWTVSVPEVEVQLAGPSARLQALDHDRISVLVVLPTEREVSSYTAGLGTEGARLEVVNLPEDVRVEAVVPATVEVKRR